MEWLTVSQDRIDAFKERIKEDPEFCEDLFIDLTIRLLAHKYAYYVHSSQFIEDIAYDIEEKSWVVMGRALGFLTEDETSPCVDFDPNHELAGLAIEYANKLKYK